MADGQRRAIEDAAELDGIYGIAKLSAFEKASLRAMCILTKRVGELASAVEALAELKTGGSRDDDGTDGSALRSAE